MESRAFDHSKYKDWIDPKAVTPYERNAKKHPPEQVARIRASIDRFGWQQDCVLSADNVLVIGHGRRLAALEIGCEMPYHRVGKNADELTEEEINALRLADNRTNESEWDFGTLEDVLAEFQEVDMSEFGFEIPGGVSGEAIDAAEDDFDIDAPVEAKAKLGDIYQLGRHRLMCGDSTDDGDVSALMDGTKADMVFTDPPYGVNYEGGAKIEDGHIVSNGRDKIKGDAQGYRDLYEFLLKSFGAIKEYSNTKSAIYVFYAHSRSREFLNAFADSGLKQRSIIVWHKTNGGFGDFMSQYMNAYEPCIYGSNGATVNWYGPTNEKTVWDMDKETVCNLHPTMKPIALVSRAIRNSSAEHDAVLDVFGGSGSTLIACEQLNRTCYMMELDPHYVDVIISRWEALTGEKAVKLNEP